MRLKKRFFACSIVVICLSLTMQSTLAYFTAESTAHNVITAGAVNITLHEEAASGESDTDNIMPGDTVSRIVTVTNHDMPAYVRVKCNISVRNSDGDSLDLGDIIQMDIDTQNWTYRDGWWYYNHLLDTGEATVPLFTQVEFSAGMENRYACCNIAIDILAQATQSANNGTDVFTAAGWPEE